MDAVRVGRHDRDAIDILQILEIEEDVEMLTHREGSIGVITDSAARQAGLGAVVQKSSRRQALVLIIPLVLDAAGLAGFAEQALGTHCRAGFYR